MKKISILGILAIISTPAMAENVPDSGVMTNNTTYTESCNNTTLGTYTGPANMTAMYTANTYNCPAGQYLVVGDANTEPKCETCPAGSYCPGINDVTYTDEMTDTGLSACPSGYANSDVGAISDGQCYTACVNDQVLHATAVSGNSYADGTNTCVPTGCEAGWHIKAETPAPDLKTLIGVTEAGNGSNPIAGEKMGFAVDYGAKGIVKGHGRCSTRAGAENTRTDDTYNVIDSNFVSTLEDETGKSGARYCYCNLANYSVNGQSQALSSSWVFYGDRGDVSGCAYFCTSLCALSLQAGSSMSLAFRDAVFGAVKNSPAMCEANTIDLKWDGVSDAGDAATCSYSGDLKTPATAPTKKGYTFTGWRVNK